LSKEEMEEIDRDRLIMYPVWGRGRSGMMEKKLIFDGRFDNGEMVLGRVADPPVLDTAVQEMAVREMDVGAGSEPARTEPAPTEPARTKSARIKG
jgi:hypothetical protein